MTRGCHDDILEGRQHLWQYCHLNISCLSVYGIFSWYDLKCIYILISDLGVTWLRTLIGATWKTDWEYNNWFSSWWRHQMETFSALLALCAGNSPSLGTSPHKGQWRGALMSSLICAWINGWLNNREAGDLRRHRAHYDVTVMWKIQPANGVYTGCIFIG